MISHYNNPSIRATSHMIGLIVELIKHIVECLFDLNQNWFQISVCIYICKPARNRGRVGSKEVEYIQKKIDRERGL